MEPPGGDPFAGAKSDFMSTFSRAGAAAQEADRSAYWSTKLHVVVSEGKNVAKDSGNDNSFYCRVAVDDEVVARTSTVWRSSSSPFFGEDFFLECRHNIQSLRLYVNNAATHDVLGVASFHRSMFEGPKALEGWFPLCKPTQQTEPHGEVLVSFLQSATATGLDHLTVTVGCARDIVPKDATTKVDPQVVILLDNEKQSTEKLKGSRYPRWDATFTFERAKLPPTCLIQLFDGGMLIGEATASLEGLNQDIPQQDWHRLMPSAPALAKLAGAQGSLRVSIHFSKELILPFPCYSALVDLLEADCTDADGVWHGLPSILEELLVDPDFKYTDREQVARMLVRLLLLRHRSVEFLHIINGLEIAGCKEATSLFRGNTMASKCTDQFMKIVGLPYLHETLKPAIDLVFREKKNCEIDPYLLSRGKGGKSGGAGPDVGPQVKTLTGYLNMIFDSIFSSVERCPTVMRLVFKYLQEDARKNPSLSEDTAFTVVSGFLFLRFFAPAVLSPKLFGMREGLADAATSRTLTLLAKALMSVGNLGASIDSGKAEYMKPLYPVIKEHLPQLKTFIDALCGLDVIEESRIASKSHTASPTSGMVMQGEIGARVVYRDTSLLTKAMKKRWVTLTSRDIRISKNRVKSAGGGEDEVFPARQFSLVEKMEGGAVEKRHALMVVVEGIDTLVLGFGGRDELEVWLQALRRVSLAASGAASRRRPEAYYPFLPNKKSNTPCAKCHGSVVVDQFADSPPAEVWAHKLFATLLEGKPGLEAKYRLLREAGDLHPRKKATVEQLNHVLDDIHLAHLLHQDQ